jgi:hypothetical protein
LLATPFCIKTVVFILVCLLRKHRRIKSDRVAYDFNTRETCNVRIEKLDTEARSRDHCCRAKAISITYSEFASLALVIQHANRMRRIILSPVAYLVVPYSSTSSQKQYHLLNILNGTQNVFPFYVEILSETFSFAYNSARYYQKRM